MLCLGLPHEYVCDVVKPGLLLPTGQTKQPVGATATLGSPYLSASQPASHRAAWAWELIMNGVFSHGMHEVGATGIQQPKHSSKARSPQKVMAVLPVPAVVAPVGHLVQLPAPVGSKAAPQ